jgi:GTP diphosphokinase / guanosine-3',5'-bis(diphosphate) 3'-diphosphatase
MTNQDLIIKARSIAQNMFSNTVRLSGITVYEHTEKVYRILKDNQIEDELTLAAAYLHPLCNDQGFDEKLISKEFGSEIANILSNYVLLKKSKFDRETPRAFNEAFFIQAFLKMSKDMRTLVLRLADKYENLQSCYVLPKELRENSAKKVIYLYATLAKVIGLSKLSRNMENEAFRVLNPREYHAIEKTLNVKKHSAKKPLDDAQNYLQQILAERGIEAKIYTRFKHVYGIYRKLVLSKRYEKNIERSISRIHDTIAMRIIVDTVDQCYEVENILDETWDSDPDERNDYIYKPRPSGYQSLHGLYTLAKNLEVEVQIRTQKMHEFNEFGPASHLLYKIGDKGAQSLAYKKLLDYTNINKFWFKDLNLQALESLDVETQATMPFAKKIYCFTPKGDIIELVKDASVIDFAYGVHTNIGNRAMGAYINHTFVGLDHRLQDGDMVEIKTQKKNNVNPDWLKIAKSPRTRSHIRKALQK